MYKRLIFILVFSVISLNAFGQSYFYLPGNYGVTSGFSIPVNTPSEPLQVHEPMYVEYNGKPSGCCFSKDPDLAWVVSLAVDALNASSAWTVTSSECYKYEEGANYGLYWYWYGGRVADFGAMLVSYKCDGEYVTNRHSIYAPGSKMVSCPDGQAPEGNIYPPVCAPIPAVCNCDENYDETTDTCLAIPPETTWDSTNQLVYLNPDNNHTDAPRCSIPLPEVDGSVNSCEQTNTFTSNPIDCATGQKKYVDVDYQGFGLDPLTYSRQYSTPEVDVETNASNSIVRSGNHWQPRDVPSLTAITFDDGASAKVFRLGNRLVRAFFFPAGSSSYQTNSELRSIVLTETNGQDVVTVSTGQRFIFNSSGAVAQYQDKKGTERYTYTWDDSTGTDLLVRVANRFGRYLEYSYDADNRLIKLTDQDGVEIHYEYDVASNLSKVIYPDGTPESLTDNPSKTYVFEDATFTDYITGIINQEGARIANIAYNAEGKATLSELHNGTDRVEVSYPTSNTASVKFYRDTATNSYREEQYTFDQFRGKYQLTSKQIIKCDSCELSTETWDYNQRELLIRHTSPAGSVTEWKYDNQDRKVSQTVAVGTPETQTTTFTWNDTHNQIETIRTMTEVTSYSFDVHGNRISTLVTPVTVEGE